VRCPGAAGQDISKWLGELFRCGCRSIRAGWRMRLARSAAQPRRPRQGHPSRFGDGSELTRLISPLKLSRSSLQIRKERLATGIRQCLGQDILLQVQEHPGWRNGLEATRQRLACRWARQTG